MYKATVKWPRHSNVLYKRENNWDEIALDHRELIARHARIVGPQIEKDKKKERQYSVVNDDDEEEEEQWTVAWEAQSFTPRCEIRQIGILSFLILSL